MKPKSKGVDAFAMEARVSCSLVRERQAWSLTTSTSWPQVVQARKHGKGNGVPLRTCRPQIESRGMRLLVCDDGFQRPSGSAWRSLAKRLTVVSALVRDKARQRTWRGHHQSIAKPPNRTNWPRTHRSSPRSVCGVHSEGSASAMTSAR